MNDTTTELWEQLKEWLHVEIDRHEEGYRSTGDRTGAVIASTLTHVLQTMSKVEGKKNDE